METTTPSAKKIELVSINFNMEDQIQGVNISEERIKSILKANGLSVAEEVKDQWFGWFAYFDVYFEILFVWKWFCVNTFKEMSFFCYDIHSSYLSNTIWTKNSEKSDQVKSYQKRFK